MPDPVQPVPAAAPAAPPVAAVSPSPAVAPEPVASPVAAPETIQTPTPAPVASAPAETPPAAPKPVTEAPAPVAGVKEPKAETPAVTSILSDAKPKEPEVKVEPKAEVKPEVKLPTYELKLPEGVKINDPEKLGAFTTALGEFENGPKDHAAAQGFAQKLMDMHVAQIQDLTQKHQLAQQEAWTKTRADWVKEFKDAPDIGQKNTEATVQNCVAVMNQYGLEAGADRLGSLKMAMRITGMGDHPEMIRFVNWASKFAVEGAKPVAAPPTRSAIPMTRSSRRYAGTQG